MHDVRIQVTNDDGISSEGLQELVRHLAATEHEIVVIAPDADWSGAGTSLASSGEGYVNLGEIRSERVTIDGAEDVEAHMAFQHHVNEMLERNGERVDAQALTPTRTWVRYGGPDAAPVTTDGPHPETSDLIAGWYMIVVTSRRCVNMPAHAVWNRCVRTASAWRAKVQ